MPRVQLEGVPRTHATCMHVCADFDHARVSTRAHATFMLSFAVSNAGMWRSRVLTRACDLHARLCGFNGVYAVSVHASSLALMSCMRTRVSSACA
eukprot:632793-Pleurochrysis_carterae.AAC.1